WSEPRFVRHRNDLDWGGLIWPDNHGRTFSSRIRLKNFPYRSPAQISRRLEVRQKQPAIFKHEANRTLNVPKAMRQDWSDESVKAAAGPEASFWQDRVRKAAECDVDLGDGSFIIRDELMPPLPSPAVDLVKVALQGTHVGRALLSPILKWRRNQLG